MKQKKVYYAKIESPWLRPIAGHKSGALAIHWVFQGMLYMDPTERWFKLGLDFLMGLVISMVLVVWFPLIIAIGLGFVVAHTFNFLFNGQIYGVLKTFGGIQNTQQEFDREVEQLKKRITQEPDIIFAAAYGSLARGEWSTTSDLDVRLVRAPGLRSAWRICWFALRERTRAFWKGFPLDLYVLDGYASLRKLSEKNRPVVLVDLDIRSGGKKQQ